MINETKKSNVPEVSIVSHELLKRIYDETNEIILVNLLRELNNVYSSDQIIDIDFPEKLFELSNNIEKTDVAIESLLLLRKIFKNDENLRCLYLQNNTYKTTLSLLKNFELVENNKRLMNYLKYHITLGSFTLDIMESSGLFPILMNYDLFFICDLIYEFSLVLTQDDLTEINTDILFKLFNFINIGYKLVYHERCDTNDYLHKLIDTILNFDNIIKKMDTNSNKQLILSAFYINLLKIYHPLNKDRELEFLIHYCFEFGDDSLISHVSKLVYLITRIVIIYNDMYGVYNLLPSCIKLLTKLKGDDKLNMLKMLDHILFYKNNILGCSQECLHFLFNILTEYMNGNVEEKIASMLMMSNFFKLENKPNIYRFFIRNNSVPFVISTALNVYTENAESVIMSVIMLIKNCKASYDKDELEYNDIMTLFFSIDTNDTIESIQSFIDENDGNASTKKLLRIILELINTFKIAESDAQEG